jgi:hypothetical protein
VLTDRCNGCIDDLRHLVAALFHALKYSIGFFAHRYAVLVPHVLSQQVINNNVISFSQKKRVGVE